MGISRLSQFAKFVGLISF